MSEFEEVRPPVEAQFDGHCPACDEPIFEGDEIVNDDDEWIHAECY